MIVPVINKIDLPSAQPDVVIEELESILAIPREEVLLVSAKDGTGVPEVLEAIVARIPPPKGDPSEPLQGLIFDSHYDPYKGVVAYVRLFDGRLGQHETVRLMASARRAEILEIGVFRPQLVPVKELGPGEVGYVATGLKSVRDCQVGDTMTSADAPAAQPLCRATSRRSRWSLPASTRFAARICPTCATRSRSCTSTTPRSASSRRRRSRSGPASAAASSACCTWRSSRSGSSASSTST